MRRVIEHKGKSSEGEMLQIVTVFEEGLSKQEVKKLSNYTKVHDVLIKRNNLYTWKKNA